LKAVSVLARRIRWKAHWALHPQKLFVHRSWWDGMTLLLPRSGSAASAYYRTFPSQAIAEWMRQSLRPGMTVVDVGAHIGVYSLLAARLVGDEGVVHAVEPQSDLLELVARNAEINGLRNVKLHALALGESDGKVGLLVNPRSRGAFTLPLERGEDGVVDNATLETFAVRERLGVIDLMKLDAAGGELAILAGGRSLLERGAIRSLICKLYHPDVVAERFGRDRGPVAIVDFLSACRYRVLLPGGAPAEQRILEEVFVPSCYSMPALAVRTDARPDVDWPLA